MIKELQSLWEDIENINLPKDLKPYDKIKVERLSIGKRVYWYYKEDLKFWKEEGINYCDAPFSGILIPVIDCEHPRNMEPDDCVVVQDIYPTEKCNPEVNWIALNRLIDNEDLVEITEYQKVTP